ncbi:MAG: cytochrome o ubiquinol oxidase subunit IV [Chlamydiota bacterium]
MIDAHHGWNVSFKPLILGFVFSLILTLAAYRIVVYYHLSCWVLTFTLIGLGVIQTLIQLVFFLHLGLESKPRWNLMMFLFTVLLMTVLVGGSLWIMHNLNYNVMEMHPNQ